MELPLGTPAMEGSSELLTKDVPECLLEDNICDLSNNVVLIPDVFHIYILILEL